MPASQNSSDVLKKSEDPKPCAKCGKPSLPGGTLCDIHAKKPSGGSSGDEHDAGDETENAGMPLALALDAITDDENRCRIYLKDSLFLRAPKPGQFFSSTNFEHWEYEGLEHLTPKEKFDLIKNVNELLTGTYEKLVEKYNKSGKFNLDYKLIKGPNGQCTYQLINKDGSDLSPEQQNSLQKRLLRDTPQIFNQLSRELHNKLGGHIRLEMVARPATLREESVLGQTPKLKPGLSGGKGKKEEEKEEERKHKSPSPFRDMLDLKPRHPLDNK